jgi:hypothetical protein
MEVSNLLECFKIHRSFQIQQVIEAIVTSEQQRIQTEQFGWKLAGAAVGLLLGSGDGFDFGDLFTAFTFSNLSSMAHSKFSERDLQFLKDIKSYWVVADGSPYDIARRIGPPRSRILVFTEGEILAFTHHLGPRGEFLIPLCMAKDICPGFTDAQSLEVIDRTFEREDVEILAQQLYPNLQGAVKLDSMRKLRDQEALGRQPELVSAAVAKGYEAIDLGVQGDSFLAFRTAIPLHSDF